MSKKIVFVLVFLLLSVNISLSAPGDLDPTFSGDGVVTYDSGVGVRDVGDAVAIQPDGKIVVVGTSFNAAIEYLFVLRYNSDGTLDTTFAGDGIATYSSGINIGNAVAIQPDGKIVVAGASSNGSNMDVVLLRFNSNGTLDSTFGTNGVVRYNGVANGSDSGNAVAIQQDGKIVVAGYVWNGFLNYDDVMLLRFNSNGTLDNTFGTNGVVVYNSMAYSTDSAEAVTIQQDGKMVIVGHRASAAGADVLVLRYNSNGTLDGTFGGSGVVVYDGTRIDQGFALGIQQDGKIVIAGITATDGTVEVLVLRYNGVGTLDNTFGTNGVVTYQGGTWGGTAYAVAIQSDGKIVVTGDIETSTGPNLLVLRYNSNGTLDNSFGINGVVTYNAGNRGNALAIQSDGKIVVTGNSGIVGDENVLTVRLLNGFTDVSFLYWAYYYIMAIYDAGITTGCSQNPLNYCPEDYVSREQMAAFIVRAAEGEPPLNYCDTGVPFPDVSSDMWSCRYIRRLKELGITTGYQDGTYGPYDDVPREQMAAFIVRAVEGEPLLDYCDSGSLFTDVTSDMWSCRYIKRLYELAITTGYGDGRYGPYDLVTRAQMAAFLSRAFLGME
jgi:uncharacterized delta-60 repeat protein